MILLVLMNPNKIVPPVKRLLLRNLDAATRDLLRSIDGHGTIVPHDYGGVFDAHKLEYFPIRPTADNPAEAIRGNLRWFLGCAAAANTGGNPRWSNVGKSLSWSWGEDVVEELAPHHRPEGIAEVITVILELPPELKTLYRYGLIEPEQTDR